MTLGREDPTGSPQVKADSCVLLSHQAHLRKITKSNSAKTKSRIAQKQKAE
jgi:hypothetical protein